LWEAAGRTFSAALHSAVDYERVVALEAEQRQLVDNLPVLVARCDPTTRETFFVNAAAERLLGASAESILGKAGLASLVVDDLERSAIDLAISRAVSGEVTPWEDRRYRHQDGTVRTLREHVHPVRDVDGAVRAVETIAYDVTTEMESRQRLMQSDRLASLGALAAGVAHEINNPVAFIGLAAGQLDRLVAQAAASGDADAAARARDLAREVGEAAARIATIVGELKLFTRVVPPGASLTPVDINRVVQTALTLTGAELRRRAHVKVDLGDLPLVPGQFASLGQVFVNLLLNASQAIEEAGPRGGGHELSVTSAREGECIVVRVRDTGVGIPPALKSRIFDPFFTTRATGGAGLGLAIAFDLVRRVGGDIRVTSAPGEGSLFEVVLPVASDERSERDEPSFAASDRRRVLVIDDEAPLARALARKLSEEYDVEIACTAAEARAVLAERSFDVVICDLRMPDQSGPAIYEFVRARSPEQAERFVFTTGGVGGTTHDDVERRAADSGRPILEKPFDPSVLKQTLARAAARAGA
jgi:PAS domain S-box-containing protein